MTKPLRIGLIMQGGRGWLGGVQYVKNIILALQSLPSEIRSTFEVCLICSESIDASLYGQFSQLLDKIYCLEKELEPITFANRIRWKLLKTFLKQNDPRFDALVKKANFDFVYPYFTTGKSKKLYGSAAWIYDFQHKYLKDLFDKKTIDARDRAFQLIASHASTVVLSSKTAEADFHKFFPESTSNTKVLSFRSSSSPTWYEYEPIKIQQKYHLPNRFFIISNQFWKHKNHLLVFQALASLQKSEVYPIVVCTGHIYDNRQPDYSDEILTMIHKLGLAKQVYLLGLIPRLDQIQLMRRSLALIQPSLFEGWSTVVEDGRCLGKRMILSDFPVHLEQNPPNSVFFERHSHEQLASLLADWWEHLLPGPNPEEEAIARTNNIKEVQAFGASFLNIARGKQ